MSHTELVYEGARPEPRLRRLLGHVSANENASRWCQENRRTTLFNLRVEQEKAEERQAIQNARRQHGMSPRSSTPVSRCRSPSDFRVANPPKLQHPQVVTVQTTEVDSDSDSDSDDSDSREEVCDSDSSDDEDYENDIGLRVYSHEERPKTEHIEYLAKSLSLKDVGQNHHVVEIATYRSVDRGARALR